MRLEQVSFSNHPGIFQVWIGQCRAIECSCTESTFTLLEVLDNEADSIDPQRIVIRVDAFSWEEADRPHCSPQFSNMVFEFLRDYPEAEREKLREWYIERDRIVKRLDEYRMDPAEIERGTLIDFREILAPPDDLGWDCPLGEYSFDCDEDKYIVIERFCPNPDCRCRSVRLSFLRHRPEPESPGRYVAAEQFNAKISLDGDSELEGLYDIDQPSAERVLNQWQDECGPELEDLVWRHEKIKEIASRSLSTRRKNRRLDPPRKEPRASKARLAHLGRNSPCPCGSGKKYKRCCGGNTQSIVDTL